MVYKPRTFANKMCLYGLIACYCCSYDYIWKHITQTKHLDMRLIDIYNAEYKTLRGRKAANTRAINHLTAELAELKTDMAAGRKYHLGDPIFLVIMRYEGDLIDEKIVQRKLNA